MALDYLCLLKVKLEARRRRDGRHRGCLGVAASEEAYHRLYSRRCQRSAPASESQDI